MQSLIRNNCIVLLFDCLIPSPSFSQNLVPNPSFELHTECPNEDFGLIELAPPWVQGNQASVDYCHICATVDDRGVPDNEHGSQWPVSGQAYAGLFARDVSGYREYAQALLDEPLVAGMSYLVSFYVSAADDFCRIRPFGVLFTEEPPVQNWYFELQYSPQIEVNGDYLGDYDNWTLISRCFVSEGNERYITIGNFRNNSESSTNPDCPNDYPEVAYYYLDSIRVEAMPFSEEEFVLAPVTVCGSYTINPGSSQNYLWSDGTTNPTLTVTESGTYYVTLSNECAFSYGEIEVTIIPDAPPVALPNDTLLCEGEDLEISLDPDAGDYEWDDGNTDSDYVISAPGEYIVELTDECDVTKDTIVVEFLDAPESFSIGEDTLICDGDAFTISLDPSLGDFEWQNGSTSSSFTINDDGTYALTISNMCGEASDEIEIEFVEPIVFSIGPDQMTLCDGDEFVIELDPALGEFLWSDNSTANTYTISGDGTISVTISNACYTETDVMLVDVLYQPVFTLGPDLTVCSGEFPMTLNMSAVDHAQSWEWTGGSTQSIFQITAPGIYSVTISNDCFAMSDEIVISVGDVDPVVNLPSDQLLCQGQSLVLDAGNIPGDYQWQDFSTADTFLVTSPGQYMLTVTTICGSGADTVVVDYVPALASPNLGPDINLCPGETAILYAGIDNVSYQWNTSTGSVTTADSLIVTAPGTYALEISDGCTSASDTIVISFNSDPPDVDLPAAIDLCQGETALIESGIAGVAYLWNDSSTGASLSVNAPGTYSLTVSNTCGSDVDSILVNDGGPAPFVELGSDISICPGEEITITPLAFDVESWIWHDGSTDTAFAVTAEGVVFVAVSNDCGLAHDTIEVTLLPDVPILDLGEDIAICPGETATITIDETNVDILWNDNSTDNEYVTANAGIIHAMIFNACGSSSDTIEIEVLPDIPILDLGADQSLCPGETITIDPGIANVSYLWNDGSNASAFLTSTPGQIILTISNDCGVSTDTLEIIEDTNGPQLDLGPDILACEGDVVIIESGISGVDYLWQDASTGSATIEPELIVTTSGIYHLQVSNACGMDTDTIFVDIHGTIPSPELGSDTALCDGIELTLLSNAEAETSIEWHASTGSAGTGSTFIVSEAGTYSLSESNHCGSASDTIMVEYTDVPMAFDLGEDVVICPGDTVVLTAPITNDLVTWSVTAGGVTIDTIKAAVYAPNTITLTVANDCGVTSDEVIISFDQEVPVVDLGSSVTLCPDQILTFDVTQAFAATYLWSTGVTTPSIVVSDPDTYTVTVSTNCYFATDDVLIESNDDCNEHELFIPNVFSPNGDNINDEWMIVPNDPDIRGIECRIFDRWGDLVYETKEMPISWNGRFGERELNPGVYVYVIILEIQEGESVVFSGDITLVR